MRLQKNSCCGNKYFWKLEQCAKPFSLVFLFFQVYFTKPDSPLPDAFIIVYSVTDRKSFYLAKSFLSQVEYLVDSKAVILVGNKTDLARLRVVNTDGKYIIHISTLFQFCWKTFLLSISLPVYLSAVDRNSVLQC